MASVYWQKINFYSPQRYHLNSSATAEIGVGNPPLPLPVPPWYHLTYFLRPLIFIPFPSHSPSKKKKGVFWVFLVKMALKLQQFYLNFPKNLVQGGKPPLQPPLYPITFCKSLYRVVVPPPLAPKCKSICWFNSNVQVQGEDPLCDAPLPHNQTKSASFFYFPGEGNQVEKWGGGEIFQVGGKNIHPWKPVCTIGAQ